MIMHKILHNVQLNEYKRDSYNIYLSVVGLFDTAKVHWTYYAVSCYKRGTEICLTNDMVDTFTNKSTRY